MKNWLFKIKDINEALHFYNKNGYVGFSDLISLMASSPSIAAEAGNPSSFNDFKATALLIALSSTTKILKDPLSGLFNVLAFLPNCSIWFLPF